MLEHIEQKTWARRGPAAATITASARQPRLRTWHAVDAKPQATASLKREWSEVMQQRELSPAGSASATLSLTLAKN
jgi:hypothetical protein